MNRQMIPARATHLSPEDLAALRKDLHEQLLFRQDQLRQTAAAAPSAQGSPSPLGTGARTEVHVKLVASARMVLTDVRAALRRMDEGRYGSCHLCRGPIGRERLTIVPQARYCARCQQAREAGQ